MTQSLNGRKFFQYGNSFVTALVSEQVLLDIDRRTEIVSFAIRQEGRDSPDLRLKMEKRLAHIPWAPIFTFSTRKNVTEHPVLTGSVTLLRHLKDYIRVNGGLIVEGRSFHVPFSSGTHNFDFRYVTCERQFEDTFGVTQAFLMRGIEDKE